MDKELMSLVIYLCMYINYAWSGRRKTLCEVNKVTRQHLKTIDIIQRWHIQEFNSWLIILMLQRTTSLVLLWLGKYQSIIENVCFFLHVMNSFTKIFT